MEMIELRSDTCTLPTKEMREAMARAEVGNDGFGEDATVNALEEKAAELLGKEAALFTASGTMGNLLANMTHGHETNEVIFEADNHALTNEFGGVSTIAHRVPRSMRGIRGALMLEDIKSMMRTPGSAVSTGLIWLENTHNNAGGTCLDQQYIRSVCDLAHAGGVPVHMDGARLFNAAAAVGRSAKDIVAPVDSVMFCISKGLCAPVGSILVGSKKFIKQARHNRKRLGGQMRQAGILAAAGIVAIEQMIDRLREDNDNAKMMAEALADMPLLGVSPALVETNIVLLNLNGALTGKAKEFAAALSKEGVNVNVRAASVIRLVTNKDVSREAAQKAVYAIQQVEKELLK